MFWISVINKIIAQKLKQLYILTNVLKAANYTF